MAEGANPYAAPEARLPPAPKRNSRIGIAIVSALVLLVAVAIWLAVSAYIEASHRMRVDQVVMQAFPWREAIGEHYKRTRTIASSPAELGKDAPQGGNDTKDSPVSMGANGVLTIRFEEGKTIVMRPQPGEEFLNWDCTGGTLENRLRPSSCRTP